MLLYVTFSSPSRSYERISVTVRVQKGHFMIYFVIKSGLFEQPLTVIRVRHWTMGALRAARFAFFHG